MAVSLHCISDDQSPNRHDSAQFISTVAMKNQCVPMATIIVETRFPITESLPSDIRVIFLERDLWFTGKLKVGWCRPQIPKSSQPISWQAEKINKVLVEHTSLSPHLASDRSLNTSLASLTLGLKDSRPQFSWRHTHTHTQWNSPSWVNKLLVWMSSSWMRETSDVYSSQGC